MQNIYKWWVKKNPVKKWNTVYTIVIQQSEIVKNQAQLQKYLAVPDIVYTLENNKESQWITMNHMESHVSSVAHGSMYVWKHGIKWNNNTVISNCFE